MKNTIFGNKAAAVAQKYSGNEFYRIFLDDPTASYEKLAITMVDSAEKNLGTISKYIWIKDKHEPYFSNIVKEVKENFKKFNSRKIPDSEKPVMLFILDWVSEYYSRTPAKCIVP